VAAAVAVAFTPVAQALSTAFTYQGHLQDNGTAYSGTCDIRFDLYNASSGGSSFGQQTRTNVTVINGVFTVSDLDFGASPFDGGDRWLEISVRCPAGLGGYGSPFAPRQQMTAVPYALFATSSSVDASDVDFSSGNLSLANSTSSSNGNILKNGTRFLHNYGTANTFLGAGAGNFSLTLNNAVGNTAVGSGALPALTSGYSNTAIGESALAVAAAGHGNVAIGQAALVDDTNGFNNTAVGTNALDTVNTGPNNIAIGYGAGSGLTTGQKNIYIGSTAAAADEENTMRLGQQGNISRTYIAGIRGTTVYDGGAVGAIEVLIDSFGQLGTVASSARVKRDIEDMGASTDRLMQLRPVTFHYTTDKTNEPQYGLVAEEVERIFPELVAYDVEGRPETIRYHLLSSMLLNEVQKQNSRLQLQAQAIAELTARLSALEAGAGRCGAR
jgi:hypothetical protein